MNEEGRYAIETVNLSKCFEVKGIRCEAIHDINISVEKGSIVSIMGPTGCGKSVLMKMLGGIVAPTSGQIKLDGTLYEKGVPKEALRKVGFVFQKDNLQAWRTVEKNLLLPTEVMRLSGLDKHRRVDDMLDLVGLAAYRKALPHELSGGMRQRVALVRALMHDPDIVLMDQPFGALDAITRRMLTYEFIRIWQKTQKTFLVVTNSIDEALLLSSKIYIIGRCPGTIIFNQKVDIPYELRSQAIVIDDHYLRLKAELRKWTAGEAAREEI